MEGERRHIPIGEDGEMLVHEDDISGGTPTGLLDLAALDAAEDMAETMADVRRAKRAVDSLGRKISPRQVALAGIVLLMFIGVILSGWYWVLPRDSVNVETQYMQRGGHLMMSEIHNTGSRAITDVVVQVHFASENGSEIHQTMRIEVESINAHSSIAGDDLEMLVVGYTVWDQYLITIELEWTDYTGDAKRQSWEHEVGEWTTEIFKDKADREFWPLN
ncbi:MAG: hypothetical protein QNL85_06885 [Euryarchaeota archaeon]|tara:strand:+ start:5005 stop:5661 length:657 start_codon:yes stop_codon:yes gene_type:complete